MRPNGTILVTVLVIMCVLALLIGVKDERKPKYKQYSTEEIQQGEDYLKTHIVKFSYEGCEYLHTYGYISPCITHCGNCTNEIHKCIIKQKGE